MLVSNETTLNGDGKCDPLTAETEDKAGASLVTRRSTRYSRWNGAVYSTIPILAAFS
jgi:hypothetical protein